MYCKLIAFNGRFMHSCPALFYVRQALDANLPGSRSESWSRSLVGNQSRPIDPETVTSPMDVRSG